MRRNRIALVLLCLALAPLRAGIEDATVLSFTVSSLPEAKLELNQSWTFPALRGGGFLTAGNSLKTALSFYVTPVSMQGGLDLTLTPIAFAQIRAGASIASGWNTPGLAPEAWGINRELPGGGGLVSGDPFEAAVWKVYGGAVFQFDVAALFPGDWNHLQIQTYQQINYRANTLALAGEPWSWENDGGENQNGFKYTSTYTLAYQMPASPLLKTIAVQGEMNLALYGAPGGRAGFGGDLAAWTFMGLANFELAPWFSFAAITQLSLDRNFTNWRRRIDKPGDAYYLNRVLNEDKPLSLNFYRFAAIFSFRLR